MHRKATCSGNQCFGKAIAEDAYSRQGDAGPMPIARVEGTV